jgi:3-oxoacyl-[acyl-carrier protein] reductase
MNSAPENFSGGTVVNDLSGQVALVTGASRGIGQAIALELLRRGALVIGTATSDSGAQAISASLKTASQTIGASIHSFGVMLDVTDASAADALIEQLSRAHGAISILVNNAGITRDNLAMRMKDEDFDAVIQTNLSAVFRMSRLVMRGMMKAKAGRIINITSVVASSGNAGQANYAASKAGVAGMTRALARELGSRNITVNCVAPGFIDTDMTKALTDEQTQAMMKNIPLARFGAPEDIAYAVAFLASPSAGYITGTTLHVNGGMFLN